jgi:hypothetical protein
MVPSGGMLDASGRVAVDAPCVYCGYNLRTLSIDGLCPECAHPVEHSLHGYFLRFGSPPWVRGLARGLLLILIALGGGLVLRPLAAVLASAPFVLADPTAIMSSPTRLVRIMAAAQFLADAITTSLAIAGVLLLTRRDPALGGRADGLTARRLSRIGCWLLPVPILGNLMVGLKMPPLPPMTLGGPPPPPSALFPAGMATFMSLSMLVGIVAIAIYAVTPLAVLRHLGGLLQRLPRPGLVRLARIEFWGLLVSTGLLVLGSLVLFSATMPMLSAVFTAVSTPTSMPSALTVTTAQSSGPGRSLTVTNIGMAANATAPATTATTMPGRPVSARPGPGFFAGLILGGGTMALGGLGSLGCLIAGVILLIMACAAFFAAAREAEQNAVAPSPGELPVPPSDADR